LIKIKDFLRNVLKSFVQLFMQARWMPQCSQDHCQTENAAKDDQSSLSVPLRVFPDQISNG